MIEWPLMLLFAFPLMAGMVCFRSALWCLEGRQGARPWPWQWPAVGCVCGLLRLSGLWVLPGDNTYSVNFFDAAWRDDGVRYLQIFGGPLGGGAAALLYHRRNIRRQLNRKGSGNDGFT